jgi:hypothetical protein
VQCTYPRLNIPREVSLRQPGLLGGADHSIAVAARLSTPADLGGSDELEQIPQVYRTEPGLCQHRVRLAFAQLVEIGALEDFAR